MLKAENISFAVGNKMLLNNVSLEFEPGKINLILGPNGAGKSTMIKILSGSLRQSHGRICYGNTGLNHISIKQLAQKRAVLSQNIDLVFPMNVRDVVMMGRYPFFTGRPTAHDTRICDSTVSFFDLDDFKNRSYTTLSGGEKQRVHFARVASQIWDENEDQKYLFLDEPLTFLDVYYQFDFMNKIKGLAEQKKWIVVGVVHDLNLAGKYGDKIALLKQGTLLDFGKKKDVMSEENIFRTYGLRPEVDIAGEEVRVYF